MSDNCEHCIQSKMQEKLEEKVLRLEEHCQLMQQQISDIEKTSALNEDRTKSLFKMLNEIKDSIKIIATKIDKLESKPGDNWNDLIKAVVLVIATAAVTYFIKK